MEDPAAFDYMRLAHPPVTFRHEKLKTQERIPAACRYIAEHGLNEHMPGRHTEVGVVVQGGLYNALVRSLQQLGLANAWGDSDIPILVLNVTYPLVPDEIADFCADKQAVMVIEEGQPEYIEQDIATLLRRRGVNTALHGKDWLPLAGEYPHHELTLSTTPNGTAPTPVLHTIRAELRLFLSQDRSHGPFVDHGRVAAYETQSYALRVRFAAVRSGWAFEENLTLHVPRTRAVPGYYGRYSFERPGLRFDADEALTVKLVQADWHGVSWGDWRALHAALWPVEFVHASHSQYRARGSTPGGAT
jgi:hypothetical protein